MAEEPKLPDGAERWLADTFAGALAQSLEAMTGERPSCEWQPVGKDAISATPEWLWWEQTLSAAVDATCWVGAPETVCLTVGRQALAAAGVEDAKREDCLGTWHEITNQGLSSVAQAIGRLVQREVNCEQGKDLEQPPTADTGIQLKLTLGGESFELSVRWSRELQRFCEPAPRAEPQAKPAPAAAGPSIAPADNSRTLALLLEVEMPVSVSFGRTQLPLKDVLKLNSGSIVELNRAVTEPVELIVNNCVIARGEVVVLEGNYGIRIRQIISREERLRTLY
ncbi:MAG: flagellar motor switch protein FliN [Acidobacteria bacterium]|nr:flagellar motor switch protein FliN [Acidobacteriota bacterium]